MLYYVMGNCGILAIICGTLAVYLLGSKRG